MTVDELYAYLVPRLNNIDATIAALSGGAVQVSILGGGSVDPIYASEGVTIEIFQGDEVSQPFKYLGDATSKTLYFVLNEDYIQNNTATPTFLIGPSVISTWSVGVEKGKTYTSGTIPFTHDNTKNLKIGNEYPFEIKEKDTSGKVITPLFGKLVIKSVIAKKTNLP